MSPTSAIFEKAPKRGHSSVGDNCTPRASEGPWRKAPWLKRPQPPATSGRFEPPCPRGSFAAPSPAKMRDTHPASEVISWRGHCHRPKRGRSTSTPCFSGSGGGSRGMYRTVHQAVAFFRSSEIHLLFQIMILVIHRRRSLR